LGECAVEVLGYFGLLGVHVIRGIRGSGTTKRFQSQISQSSLHNLRL
jgi:hypothetical protein